MGRLVACADIPAAAVSHLAVFVEMDKGPAHVRMWKSGLEAGLEEINGGDDVRRSRARRRKAVGRARPHREDRRGMGRTSGTTSGQWKIAHRIYGIKVSFWESGILKIVILVENYPGRKRRFGGK